MLPYIGNFIPSYSIFAIIGLFSMMMMIYLRNELLLFKEYLLFIMVMVLGAVIGSKLLFILTQIPDIISHFSIEYAVYKVMISGFVFYGGLFGAIAGNVLFAKIRGYSSEETLDLAVPGYSLFHVFGRIGCFFAGCCYGKEADWGVALWNEPEILRIPIQLIESLFLLLLTTYMVKIEKRKRCPMIKIYLVSYAVFRFIIEFWRGDIIRGMWGALSTSQWISIVILTVFCIQKLRDDKVQLRNVKR